MKGIEVKNKLEKHGHKLVDIAKTMKETPQNLDSMLRAADIKTGVLERIANAINESLYFFFDQEQKKDVPNDTPLNEIVNVLKELAGSVKEISSAIRDGYTQSTPSQSRTPDISESERILASVSDEQLESQMELRQRQQATIQKQKRDNQQGDSQV